MGQYSSPYLQVGQHLRRSPRWQERRAQVSLKRPMHACFPPSWCYKGEHETKVRSPSLPRRARDVGSTSQDDPQRMTRRGHGGRRVKSQGIVVQVALRDLQGLVLLISFEATMRLRPCRQRPCSGKDGNECPLYLLSHHHRPVPVRRDLVFLRLDLRIPRHHRRHCGTSGHYKFIIAQTAADDERLIDRCQTGQISN